MTGDDRIPDGRGGDTRRDEALRLDWTAYGEPSSGIVEAVSRVTDERATDLPPLHDAVETDALNVLLEDEARAAESTFTVTFSYADHRITASADGEVVVRAQER